MDNPDAPHYHCGSRQLATKTHVGCVVARSRIRHSKYRGITVHTVAKDRTNDTESKNTLQTNCETDTVQVEAADATATGRAKDCYTYILHFRPEEEYSTCTRTYRADRNTRCVRPSPNCLCKNKHESLILLRTHYRVPFGLKTLARQRFSYMQTKGFVFFPYSRRRTDCVNAKGRPSDASRRAR